MWIWVILCAVAAGVGYIQLAPSEVSRWHVPVTEQEGTLPGGVVRIVPGNAEAFARLDSIIQATARTKLLAGSVSEGRMTYVTRTRVFGFPDYTTVELRDGSIVIYARLRFGKSDLGVNGRRVDGWLNALIQTG